MSFFSDMQSQPISLENTINTGDTVQIIGKDQYKGWIGTVAHIKDISGEKVFIIELQATSERIERFKDSLRKQYLTN